jgi:cell division protein FtsN
MSRKDQTRKAKPRSGRLILACVAALAVLLLLLRMLNFVHGRR